LIIEVDGDEHALREGYDQNRTKDLQNLGYFVRRYGNNDIMNNIDGVIHDILSSGHEQS
jgi:very-short-patch-repair endonuclease